MRAPNRHPACVAGCSAASSRATRARSAPACSTVTPGRSRAVAIIQLQRAASASAGSGRAGTHRSVFTGKRNPRGITPTTVVGVPLTTALLPSTSARPPNWLCHTSCPRITTGSAPGRSSSGRKPRPSAGRTPSSGNRSWVTGDPWSRTGSPSPARLKPRWPAPATAASVRLRARISASSPVLKASCSHSSRGACEYSRTTRSPSANGSGRRSTVLTMLNVAVFTPIPSARHTIAAAANPRDLPRLRSA